RRLSQLCPPYATPSSNSSFDYRRSDARIVENGFATSGGVSKSAKVVLDWTARHSTLSGRVVKPESHPRQGRSQDLIPSDGAYCCWTTACHTAGRSRIPAR